jgi:hypothetical protein
MARKSKSKSPRRKSAQLKFHRFGKVVSPCGKITFKQVKNPRTGVMMTFAHAKDAKGRKLSRIVGKSRSACWRKKYSGQYVKRSKDSKCLKLKSRRMKC